MKKFNKKIPNLWMDDVCELSQEKGKENNNILNLKYQFNTLSSIDSTKNNISKKKQNSFVARFKDKMFFFNKAGKICKLEEANFLRSTLIIKSSASRKKINSSIKNILQTKRHQLNLKISNNSTRMSAQSVDCERIVKSLDASKISRVLSKEKRNRYGSDCYQIRQQQMQETTMKVPTKQRRIFTPSQPKRNIKCNQKRTIYFEMGNVQQKVENLPCQEFTFCKKTEVLQNQLLKNKDQSIENIKNISQHQSNYVQNKLPLINRSIQARSRKRSQTDSREIESESISNQRKLLPKIKFNKIKKIGDKPKQLLLTIR